jgi:hypothetical protein
MVGFSLCIRHVELTFYYSWSNRRYSYPEQQGPPPPRVYFGLTRLPQCPAARDT